MGGSIPDEVIGFFFSIMGIQGIMALRSTQALREMNTWNIPGGGG
jgi:hypothetical protein